MKKYISFKYNISQVLNHKIANEKLPLEIFFDKIECFLIQGMLLSYKFIINLANLISNSIKIQKFIINIGIYFIILLYLITVFILYIIEGITKTIIFIKDIIKSQLF